MAKTNIDLVAYVQSKIGTPYVYGTKMELLTQALYNSLKKQYGSLVWPSDADKIGKVCTDCSGLISGYTGIIRGSAQYKEKASAAYPISSISTAPLGALVWKSGHIGVYVSNGEYIAADGSAYNTRKGKLPYSFTHWFRCSDITYVSEASPQPPPQPQPPPSVPQGPDDWAKTAWEWAKAKGFMDGTRPKDFITRQEIAQLLWNLNQAGAIKT